MKVNGHVGNVVCYVGSTDVECCEKADWHSLTLLKLGIKMVLNISPPSPWFQRLIHFDSSEGKAVVITDDVAYRLAFWQ